MPAVDDAEEVIVAGESQGLVHFLIEQEPVAGAVFHVVRAGGEIGANRLGLELADERGKLMAAAKSDEAAAVGIDAAEGVGPFPGRVEGRDAAAAAAGDAAIVAAGGQFQVVRLGHEGQELLDKEADVIVAHAVVFEAAIAAAQVPFTVAGRSPGLTKTPMVTGISLAAISVSSRVFSWGYSRRS